MNKKPKSLVEIIKSRKYHLVAHDEFPHTPDESKSLKKFLNMWEKRISKILHPTKCEIKKENLKTVLP